MVVDSRRTPEKDEEDSGGRQSCDLHMYNFSFHNHVICICLVDVSFFIDLAFYFHLYVFFICVISWPRHISSVGVKYNFNWWLKVRIKQEYMLFLIKNKVKDLKC